MSSRLGKQNAIELSSFRSAFLADDSLVTIIPDFDYSHDIPLMSASTKVGPFRAGIPTEVPLWFALMLQQRSLCSLKVLDWLATENLTRVKQHETTQTTLTPTTSTTTSTTTTTNDSDDTTTLPFYYAELGQRFVSAKSHSQAAQAPKASRLLLQDIAQVRLDKLRQQFQQLTRQQMANPSICVAVPGIASAELATLKPLITQALNDQRFLATSAAADAAVKKKQPVEDSIVESQSQEESVSGNNNNNTLRSRIRRLRG
ncbi:GINS protein PSF2 [Seminavis robusta]|uniref:GINS protein PSF2 n=1 Tax=Seminavis robusta TaxID=568900 RepID=A0A9N8DRE0_9STRA|nr:GINS protein PSF2 [Seminavis robusta]|eukprot:Sro286_g108210.1 GINS protein PSF2 (259) ;mRNA; r:3690-4466